MFKSLIRIDKTIRFSNFLKYSTQTITEVKQPTVIKPLEHEDFFDIKKLVDLKVLFNNRVHYGHHMGVRNPWMADFIFGTRMNIDIIDLEKTCELFKSALNFVAHVAFQKGIILFITKDPATIPIVERLAKETGEYAQCRKWQSGTFTDSVKRFGTVIRFPDVVVFLNTNDGFNEQHRAVRECANMLIPTVAVVDTSNDPNLITYPIPGNDDSIPAIELYCNLFKTVILTAKQKRADLDKQNCVIE